VVRPQSRLTRLCVTAVFAVTLTSAHVTATARIADSTPVPVRLLGVINSETSRPGQPLEFTVADDVYVDGELVIKKGTPALGVVVVSKRARWGPLQRHPKLTFRFTNTTASNGQTIALRATRQRNGGDGVVPDRSTQERQMLWAGGTDLFEAYVDGDYEL